MKILLLGQGGQVGWELQRALAPLGELIGADFGSPGERKADFSQPETVQALLERVRPDIVVNAAAHTAVDKAESEPELARAINASTPGLVARWAAAHGAWLVHYSTDYVFDGSGSAARDETAATAPLSVYGRTKREAEELIAASGCRHLILRTSWVYAARGGNFAKTMLKLAAEREALKVIDDQIGAPTGAELLADVTAHALRVAQARPEVSGLYHCTAAGETSWHGYATQVLRQAQAAGVALKVAPEAVQPIPTCAYPTPAQRPLNSRLDCRKFSDTFGLRLPEWQRGVERMLTEVLAR
ncbi:dTDP-4-dehydrorhamnose reductase [Pseudaquabacterium rugosum]|uniref:dTDP-4-dehydrorhamnose reductase n=1 Tax=Pseudaquabacterium rugosum TaxID=2984194 RepID=A0ABU9B998_9BURK